MNSIAPMTRGRSSVRTAESRVMPVPGQENTPSMMTLPSMAKMRL